MAGTGYEGDWDYLGHGVYENEFASILRKLLHYMGYDEQPIYRGLKATIGEDESWTMQVYIYPKSEQEQPHVFTTEHRRSTRADAIQDAARLAAARLCDIYETAIRRTPYRFYPSRQDGARYNETNLPVDEDDPALTHQVTLTRAMGAAHTAALEEITLLRQRLTTGHGSRVALREQLAKSEQALAQAQAEVAALQAQLRRASTPAAAPAPPPPGSGPRTRMTARKSTRPPGPRAALRGGEPPQSRSPPRAPSDADDSDPSEFSGSRSRSRSPHYSPSGYGYLEE